MAGYRPITRPMKILLCFFLLLCSFEVIQSRAGFVVARSSSSDVHILTDSPVVSQPTQGHRHIFKPSQKQVAGYGILSLGAGLLSVAGVIALFALWPMSTLVVVALSFGILLSGIGAMIFGYLDSLNKKPHLILSLMGFTLGVITTLPVQVLVTIGWAIHDLVKTPTNSKRKRMHARAEREVP